MNELAEEQIFESEKQAIDSKQEQRQKVNLITNNLNKIRKIVKLGLVMSLGRLFLFSIIMFDDKQLISRQKASNQAQSWNVIFYILASMMDFLSLLNDATTLKLLKKEEASLVEIKNQILQKKQQISNTNICSYVKYLSIYQLIVIYKYKPRVSSLIYQTVRCLHLSITFYIFGHLAIRAQSINQSSQLACFVLWFFILTIYFSNFEIDYIIIQGSSGPFIEKRDKIELENIQLSEEQMNKQAIQYQSIKKIFIKSCRIPYQTTYIIGILAILTYLILYFKLSLLNFMLIFCILTHMIQLIFQKSIQNKLLNFNFKSMPFKYFSPFRILHEITKQNKTIFLLICSLTRYSIVLANLAYFRELNISLLQTSCLIGINFILIFAQIIKFKRCDSCKLYSIKSEKYDSRGSKKIQCSICLLEEKHNQSILKLPCFQDHIFHTECMKKWFRQRKQCPLCRHSLQIYDIS